MAQTYAVQEAYVLDDIHASLKTLGVRATDMGNELNQHNIIMGDLDGDMDDTGNTLTVVQSKTQRLLDRSKKCFQHWGIIILLVCSIFILVLLLIFG
jgi:syntaxin 6